MVRKDHISIIEEIFNAISHGLGVVTSIIGFVILMTRAHSIGQPERFWGFMIYGITLVLMYLTSTLFHSLTFTKAHKVFKILDYSSISLLIAGSYTPIALVILKNDHGWILTIGVWLLAIFGILWRIFGIHRDKLLLILYLLTGWIAIFFIRPLMSHLPPLALFMLLLGGFFYSVGTIFFQWRKLAFNDGIWHIFVLLGSICHFIVMMYV